MVASLFLLAELDFRTQLQSVRAPSAPLSATPLAPHACLRLRALMVCVCRPQVWFAMATANERQHLLRQPALLVRPARHVSNTIGLRSARMRYRNVTGGLHPPCLATEACEDCGCHNRRHPSCRHQCPAAADDDEADAPLCSRVLFRVSKCAVVRVRFCVHRCVPAILGCRCVHAAFMQSQSAFLNATTSV